MKTEQEIFSEIGHFMKIKDEGGIPVVGNVNNGNELLRIPHFPLRIEEPPKTLPCNTTDNLQTCPGDGQGGPSNGDKTSSDDRRRFHCDWENCRSSFMRGFELSRHKMAHLGQKKFTCDWDGCDARFTLQYSLKRHRQKHTGEKNFVCSICGVHFARKDNLTRHLRRHSSCRNAVYGF